MKKYMIRIKKSYLKWKFKRIYLKIQAYDMYDCGISMQTYMDSRFQGLLDSYNETADALAKIDPAVPEFRY